MINLLNYTCTYSEYVEGIDMFCCKCGNQLLISANFCTECGNKVFVNIVDYNKLHKINNVMCYEGKPYSGSGVAYYCNGQKKHEETYHNGLEHGKWSYWYEDGTKAQEIHYVDNVIDGLDIEWFENGQKKSEVSWSKGILNGLWISWYPSGQKEGEVIYTQGKKNGCETMWYENGKKYSKGMWNKGVQNGFWIAWESCGKVKWQGNCKEGEMIFDIE
mgnify:CR=1 FL=1